MLFINKLKKRVQALPGVRSASFSMFTFHEGSWNDSIFVHGYTVLKDNDVKHNIVGDGYFLTMGIPLIAGRTFEARDTATSQRVAIISETMAHRLFPEGSAIGHHFGIADPKHDNDLEVIGVVKDVKFHNIEETTQYVDYLPYSQSDAYLNDFEVRYAGDFQSIASEVSRAIHSVDRNLPISDVKTLNEQIARSITEQRVVAQLSAFFGLLAVFLSCIGIYGLMSYVVVRRTNEIGIRMALGADRADVRWLVVREILWMVMIGLTIGLSISLAGNRLITSMLFGLRPADPFSLFAAIGILLLIATFAGYLPARRASRIDPIAALREE